MSNKILGIVAATLFFLCIIALIPLFYIIPKISYNNTSQSADNLAVSEDYNYKAKSSNNIDDFENSAEYTQICNTIYASLSDQNPNISYDSEHKLFMVIIYTEGMAEKARYYKSGLLDSKDWYKITALIRTMDAAVYDAIIKAGYYDVNTAFALVSDEDHKSMLYGTVNGKENYNYVSDY